MSEKKLNKKFWDEFEETGTKIIFEMPDFNSLVDKNFVKTLRMQLGFSQQVFANSIGVSKKAVEKWEQGVNPVIGPTARLMYIINENNDIMSKIYNAYILKPDVKQNESFYNYSNVLSKESVFVVGEDTRNYNTTLLNENSEFKEEKGDLEWKNTQHYHHSICLDTIYSQ